jgi:predicted GNAT superfamily acetyltransferase
MASEVRRVEQPQIEIRKLETIAEYHQAEALQQAAWNMPDAGEAVPVHLLVTAQKNGGLVLGAFDGSEMAGFLFGFAGLAGDGKVKHCSHMLATHPAYRGRGVGKRLKEAQREFVLRQGLDLVTWTYDPLERVNAYLNIARLGAVCRTYLRNVYGELHDELNRGLPSDRFQVDWWVGSQRVARRLAGTDEPSYASASAVLAAGGVHANEVLVDDTGLATPRGWAWAPAPLVLVEVPANFQKVKAHDLALARDWRDITRAIFERYFDEGYTVIDFLAPPLVSHRAYYLLVAGQREDRETNEMTDGS